jgi:DNA polymerase-3 subunit alpha
MQKRWNSEEYQLRLKEVRMLETVAQSMTESITLQLPLETLTEKVIDEIDQLCQTHKGQHKLRMRFIDRSNRTTLMLASKNRLVHADNDFITELERIGVSYKLNG